jgi:hypothetical protein
MRTLKGIASLILLSLAPALNAQQHATAPTVTGPPDYKLAEFEVKDSSFVEAVSQLSRQAIEGLHLGLEEVLREKMSDPPLQGPHFSLSLHKSTVREIVDSLCSYDSRYTWSLDGKTINIYPKTATADDAYLLNRRLEQITVTAIPDPGQGLTFLDRQLPPPREQLGYAGAGGDFSYIAPWTQTFHDLTVRQFINRLSEHMGSHTSWVFYGSKQERLFTFLKGGFH